MAVNKVVLNDVVKLDLTADTVTPETLAEGVTAHDAAGNPITGTMTVTTPTLTVKTNAGASVTATKGDYTVSGTADSSGFCVLDLPEFGEWTVTATLGGETATITENISALYDANVYLSLDLVLTGTLSSTRAFVTVSGENYSSASTLKLSFGESITVDVSASNTTNRQYAKIYFNGEDTNAVLSSGHKQYTFSIEENTTIHFYLNDNSAYTAEITTASYDTSAAVASILLGEDI